MALTKIRYHDGIIPESPGTLNIGDSTNFVATVTAQDFNSVSDLNLKTNIESIENALDRLTDRLPFDPEYKPTAGIRISPNFYLTTPMKLVLTAFNMKNNNLSIKPFNDIIHSIEIKDGILCSVKTIEPLVIIG